MYVYGDIFSAPPDPDEGAENGDLIRFTVNHHPAVTVGNEAPLWDPEQLYIPLTLQACTLPGDFDCSGNVSVRDVMLQVTSYGTWPAPGYYPPYDWNSDHEIDFTDTNALLQCWRAVC